MNEFSYIQQGDVHPSRSFKLSPASAGAFTGILATLFVSLLYRSIGFISLSMAFFYPGHLILGKMDALDVDTSGLTAFLIYYGVSFIPPAFIGTLIFSDRITLRISGIAALIIHAILLLAFSFFLHIMAD